MNIISSLNQKQREAVTLIKGPVLVIAGPGSGKTKCLTHRIAYLIQQGISSRNILAVTFTNKAAQEMKERVRKLVSGIPDIGTFHAICVQILRREIKALGYEKQFVIYDNNDQLTLVKKIIKELEIDTNQFNPRIVLSTISQAKNELTDCQKYSQKASDYFPQVVSQIYSAYQKELKKSNALDFDDLIMLTVKLFEKNPDILDKYQERWQYILVDEYQDTSHSQYVLINLLAKKYHNIFIIGDDWQCLPGNTKINTPKGAIPISQIKQGNVISAASGKNETCKAIVSNVKQSQYNGFLRKIYTKSGKTIILTPNHIIFLRLALNPDIHYVYLMFRKDKGYRIGIAKGSRFSLKGKAEIGLLVRSNQEKADKMWVLKVCFSKADAHYWESYFSFFYGIPTTIFFAADRKVILTQEMINQIYGNIDTLKRARKLMKDLYLYSDFPHFSPQGVTKKNQAKRIKLRVTMFSDNRKTTTSPWGLSRISINTSDTDLKTKIEELGFSVRKGKAKDWVTEIARVDYGEIERIAHKIKLMDNRLDVLKTALLTENKRFLFQPASHAHPTMIIPVEENGRIVEDEIVKTEQIQYSGKVYDLNIKNIHNYIADNFVVHNSIYSWRGADFRNILNFEKDYPDVKTITLEQNYRSTKNILEASHYIISKNVERKEKNLWTDNSAGSLINVNEVADEEEEGEFITAEIDNLINQGYGLEDMVVLYRANAQSRAIEESFLKAGMPYKIIGNVRFYDRKEIKDLLAYLQYIVNPHDMISFSRIVNTPPRRLVRLVKDPSLQVKGSEKFFALIDEFRDMSRKVSLTELISCIIEKTGYEEYIKSRDDGERRWENVREIFTVAEKYDLEKFLEEVALLGGQDEVEGKGMVNMMTIHCAKGLEFPIVFLIGCEDGVFPHSKSLFDAGQMEEERRLCYVALTRAKKKAYLTFARRRRIFGQATINPPSRFVLNLPEHLVDFNSS